MRINVAGRGQGYGVLMRKSAPEDAMFSLMMTLFSMIATTTMGIGVVIALTMGLDTWQPLVVVAVIGFLVAVPISWFLAKSLP